MTKIKALITMLVLGTSAAAFAAPSNYDEAPTGRDHREQLPMAAPTSTPDVRDHREPMPAPQASWKHRLQWTTLAGSAQITGRSEFIRVGARAGAFDRLKLQQLTGTTQIKLVQVNFSNGQSQWVRLNTTLNRHNTVASIMLDGQNRSIKSIVVYGSGNARASYAILAA